MVEVMGKHSNIILIDADGTVLGALKIVPPRQSRVRPIVPGGRYTPPPPRERDEELFGSGERVDPYDASQQFLQLLQRAPAQTPLSKALMGLLPGAGPFLVGRLQCEPGRIPTVASISMRPGNG